MCVTGTCLCMRTRSGALTCLLPVPPQELLANWQLRVKSSDSSVLGLIPSPASNGLDDFGPDSRVSWGLNKMIRAKCLASCWHVRP